MTITINKKELENEVRLGFNPTLESILMVERAIKNLYNMLEEILTMAKKNYSEWSPKAMAKCCGIFGFIIGIIGIIWHGALDQPTIAGILYPWFTFSDPSIALGVLAGFTAIGYVSGYVWALLYNWALKK